MPTVSELLSLPRAAATASQSLSFDDTQDTSTLVSALKDVGGAGLGAVASLGNFLDLPGSSVRDLLAGENPFDQWLSPLSDENRVTGRQLLEQRLGMRANKETGISGWFSDPGEGLRDLAGFGAEVALDPFGPLTGWFMAGTKAGRAVAKAAGQAHPLVKALGRGARTVFDTLPASATKYALNKANVFRTAKDAMFDPLARGVTDPLVQPMAKVSSAKIVKLHEEAMRDSAQIGLAAQKVGFHLDVDRTLDPADPSTWLNPRSAQMVSAREDALRRVSEDVHRPSQMDPFDKTGVEPTLNTRDIVTIGETPDLKEVEFTNRTANGTQVKLVGDNNWYSDTQLKPSFLNQNVTVPDEVRIPMLQLRDKVDALRTLADSVGIPLGLDQDAYGLYFPRMKSDVLRRGEAWAEMDPIGWRRGLRSLVATLKTPGGRDIALKGFKDKTMGVQRLFRDGFMQHNVDVFTKRAQDVGYVGPSGKEELVFPNMAGIRHIESFADELGVPPEEMWEEIVQAQIPMQQSRAFAVTKPDGLFDVIENGNPIGSVSTSYWQDAGEMVGRIDHAALDPASRGRGLMQDVFPQIERRMQQHGATRLETIVDPVVGDKIWKKQGFRQEGQAAGTAQEKWVKDLYPGKAGVDLATEDPSLVSPRMVHVDEVEKYISMKRDEAAAAVRADPASGIQPGVGWWKRWQDLLDSSGQKVHNFKMEDSPTQAFTQFADEASLMAAKQAGFFNGRMNYFDIALANLAPGNPVYIGSRVVERGRPAVSMIVAPLKKARLEMIYDKMLGRIHKGVKETPLTLREGIMDSTQQAITRNYGHEIDRWMPQIGEDGLITASSPAEEVHKATLSQWQRAYPEMKERLATGGNLTQPMRTLLQLDDESLQALQMGETAVQDIKSIRDNINSQVHAQANVAPDEATRLAAIAEGEINPNVSIGLLDRHAALATEVGESAMKRALTFYNPSAAVSGYQYLRKNLSAVTLADEMANTVTDFRELRDKYPSKIGTKVTRGDPVTKYDPEDVLGVPLGDLMDDGPNNLFSGSVDTAKWLEHVRQKWIARKFLTATEDADVIAKQYAEIKSITARQGTWGQMKTMNEVANAGQLPELDDLMKYASSGTSLFKAGVLATSPATAVRDGSSSFFQSVVMGDMNPITAIRDWGSKAFAFARGKQVDPGEGIKEIEAFLESKGLPSNPQTRGQALQNFWNAHFIGGSIHPNVVSADEARMATGDTTMALLEGIPNRLEKSRTENLVGAWKEKGSLNPGNVAGTWTKDAQGRWIQRSTNNFVVSMMNGFRANIDTTNRALFVLDRMAKTKSIEEAFKLSDHILLNAHPKNFTRFETQYLKSVVPFYSFMRQSIPMFLSEFMKNPGGKLGMTVRATRHSQGDSSGYVPFEYRDTAAIGIGTAEDGTVKYLTSLGLMHEDAVKYAGNILQHDARGLLQNVIESGNPLLKWMVEYSTNTSLFSQGPMGARRLDELDPSLGRIATNLGLQELAPSGRAAPVGGPLVESLIAASPASRIISMAKIATTPVDRSSAAEKVLRLLTGARIETVTPQKITTETRDQINALQIEAGARPLTITSGVKGLKERLTEQGKQTEVDRLERMQALLQYMKRQSN